jgi:hypothetical protein
MLGQRLNRPEPKSNNRILSGNDCKAKFINGILSIFFTSKIFLDRLLFPPELGQNAVLEGYDAVFGG